MAAADQGQRVVFFTRDLTSTRRWLSQFPATVGLAPSAALPTPAMALEQWQLIVREFEPDLVVAVDSPAAVAAIEHSSCRSVVLSLGATSSSHVPNIATIVTTLPELCDPTLASARCVGAHLGADGTPPRWPSAAEAGVFALLELHPKLPVVLDMLRRLDQPVLAAILECPSALMTFNGASLGLEAHPVQLDVTARQCSTAILHGDAHEASFFLQHGVPLFLLPTTEAQQSTADRVAQLGAGVVADIESPLNMAKAWLELRANPRYRAAAQSLAAQHGHLLRLDPFQVLSSILAT